MLCLCLFSLSGVSFFPVFAEGEKRAEDWLAFAAEQASEIQADDDRSVAEAAYLRATLFYRLAILEQRAKREERAFKRMADTQAAIQSYLDHNPDPSGDRPVWTYSYLYGPAEVIDWPDLPAGSGKFDKLTQLHIDTVRAEALLRVGRVDDFSKLGLALFTELSNYTRGNRTHIPAGERIQSHGIAWQMSLLSREAKNKELAFAFAARRWTGRAEAIVAQAISAQITGEVHEEEIAAFSLDRLEKYFKEVAPRDQEAKHGLDGMQYGYRTDWNSCYVELITAGWTITGRDAAKKIASKHFGNDRSWLFPSAVRTAQLNRVFGRARDKSSGHSALNAALNIRFRNENYPEPAAFAMLGYEAAARKRAGLLDPFIKRNEDPVVRGFTAVGAAEGMLRSR